MGLATFSPWMAAGLTVAGLVYPIFRVAQDFRNSLKYHSDMYIELNIIPNHLNLDADESEAYQIGYRSAQAEDWSVYWESCKNKKLWTNFPAYCKFLAGENAAGKKDDVNKDGYVFTRIEDATAKAAPEKVRL